MLRMRNSSTGPKRSRRLELEALEERALLSTLFVVRADLADGKTKFDSLAAAIPGANFGDTIQIEPNSAPGSATIPRPLIIQGDPAFGPATLPLIPSLTVEPGTASTIIQNLDLGSVTLDDGETGTTISHCLVANITEASGNFAGNGGSNTISADVITGQVILGNTSGEVTLGDQVINNNFVNSTGGIAMLFLQGADNVTIQGNTFTATAANDIPISLGDATASILNNVISLGGGPTTFPGIFIEGINGLTRAAVKDNRISSDGGVGISIFRPSTDSVLEVDVEANDLAHNGLGVRVGGDGAGSFDDFGTVNVFSGNDFHGYTASSPAIVTDDQGAKTTDGVFAEGNIFSVNNPSTVVRANAGSIDVTSPLTPNQSFVERLYEDFLQRQASFSDLNAWAGQIAKIGRSGVANDIIHSAEADARLVDQLYLQYLGRPADPGGESFWVKFLQAGHSEEDVLAGLLGSSEFYNRAQQLANLASPDDPDADFVRALYETLLGRAGSQSEISSWVVQLPSLGRAGVINEITHSLEFRTDQVANFYLVFVHRNGSTKEIQGFAQSNLDLISIEAAFAGSSEFFANG